MAKKNKDKKSDKSKLSKEEKKLLKKKKDLDITTKDFKKKDKKRKDKEKKDVDFKTKDKKKKDKEKKDSKKKEGKTGDKKKKDNKTKDTKKKEKKTKVKKGDNKPMTKVIASKPGKPGRKRISSIVTVTGADISLHHNAKIAVSRLRRLTSITAINNFIKGDNRGTVVKVAEIVKERLRKE